MNIRCLHFWMIVLIAVAGVAAYWNSFSGVFVLDDRIQILGNTRIRRLWPPWEILSGPRPFLHFTFALNYAVSGVRAWSYHAVNLGIPILAALTLFGIIRRTLERLVIARSPEGTTPVGQAAVGRSDTWHRSVGSAKQSPRLLRSARNDGFAPAGLAFWITLLWMVHPLQTQSVTYIVQRGESMMGLFYLLSLYCVIRGIQASSLRGAERRSNLRGLEIASPSARNDGRVWHFLSILSCFLGMATKEVMVTAPIVILIYDRIFLSNSWAEVFKERKWLYLGLVASWGVLGTSSLRNLFRASSSAGFGFEKISPLQYALTQPGVILHYLKLSFWPHPLVIDYAWPVARGLNSILPPLLAILALLGAALMSLRRWPQLGFLGVWFFLILAPTSSIMPIADACFEHRMYLPLASLLALSVLAADHLRRTLFRSEKLGIFLFAGLLLVLSLLLGVLTVLRNRDYASEIGMWQDAISKRPANPRALNNLGKLLEDAGDLKDAEIYLRRAILLKPDLADAQNNLGVVMDKQGKVDEAVHFFREALRISPNFEKPHYNLGNVFAKQDRLREAVKHYRSAVRLKPDYAMAHLNLGSTLAKLNQFEEGVFHIRTALRLSPDHATGYRNLGNILVQQGKLEEALNQYSKALELAPDDFEARTDLGAVLVRQGKEEEALVHFTEVLQSNPTYARAHYNMGNLLAGRGKVVEAVRHYEEAIKEKPDYEEARNNLGAALLTQGKFEEAALHFSELLKLKPDDPSARENLAIVREELNKQQAEHASPLA